MQIIKIGAKWCPPCLNLEDTLHRLQSEKSFDLKILDIDNNDDETEVTKYLQSSTIPEVIILSNNGVELERFVGNKSKDELIALIEKYEN